MLKITIEKVLNWHVDMLHGSHGAPCIETIDKSSLRASLGSDL